MTPKGSSPVLRGLVGSNAYLATRLSHFVQMLAYKCLRFGKELHIISERDTTKRCHACQHMRNTPLWMRTYRCENCGLVMDRDENSAINLYQQFVAGLPPHRE